MKQKLFTTLALAILSTSMHSCRTKTKLDDPTTKPIKTFTGQMQCLWDESKQANPKCFLDIDNGKVYDVATAQAHASEIDLIWVEASGGSILVCSPTEYLNYPGFAPTNSPNFVNSILLSGWSVTNPTRIDFLPAHTVANYNAISNEPTLLSMVGDNFNSSTIQWSFMDASTVSFNRVFFVETSTGGVKKKGFIHFTSGQTGLGNFVNFEIKIQQ